MVCEWTQSNINYKNDRAMVLMQGRNYGLDVLRVLACYMVIQVHAGEFFYIGEGGRVLTGENAHWVALYNSLCRSSVPLFVMLSGFFLLPVKEEMGVFFKKRFTRVLIPFLVWCVLYAFYQFFMGQVGWQEVLLNILRIPVNFGTEVGHLWYVYMLIGLYLFAPIISPWVQTAGRKSLEFFLTVWGVTLFVPYIHLVFPAILGECFWNKTPLLYYFSGFMGYAVLACYIKSYWMEKRAWNIPVGIALVTVGYVVTYWGYVSRLGTAEFVPELELTWGFETVNVAMMSLGLFLLIKNIKTGNSSSAVSRLVTDISVKSYGMYLLNIMLLNFYYSLFNPLSGSAMVKVPLIAVATFVSCYLVIKLLALLPKSKYLVG